MRPPFSSAKEEKCWRMTSGSEGCDRPRVPHRDSGSKRPCRSSHWRTIHDQAKQDKRLNVLFSTTAFRWNCDRLLARLLASANLRRGGGASVAQKLGRAFAPRSHSRDSELKKARSFFLKERQLQFPPSLLPRLPPVQFYRRKRRKQRGKFDRPGN